jgi:hypothetical protein
LPRLTSGEKIIAVIVPGVFTLLIRAGQLSLGQMPLRHKVGCADKDYFIVLDVASEYFGSRYLLDFLPVLLENSLQIGGMERRGRSSHFFERSTSHTAPNSPILVASIKANSLSQTRPKEVISKDD